MSHSPPFIAPYRTRVPAYPRTRVPAYLRTRVPAYLVKVSQQSF